MLLTIATVACDQTFRPISFTNLKLSVFGYLDASADTQWIRITPIRSITLTDAAPLPVEVTLKNIATGRVIEMQDSLFHFEGNPEVGSEGAFHHNFWTTERIEPGASYRFVAELVTGERSEAVIKIPPSYEIEVWLTEDPYRTDFLRLEGLEYVAFVDIVTQFYDRCGLGLERSSFRPVSTDPSAQMIAVSKGFATREGCGTPQIERQELRVVGSGDPWPSGDDFSPTGLGIADTASNISNAVGYVGGVLSKAVPYENCRLEGGGLPDYCHLRYDSSAANLSGTVTDPVCTGDGVAGATVELRELGRLPPTKPKIRYTATGHLGRYEIGALEGGVRYALSISRYIKSDPADQYVARTDTLEFAAGEHRTYNVGLRRFECPPE